MQPVPHNQLFPPIQHNGLVYCAIPSRQGQYLPPNTSLPPPCLCTPEDPLSRDQGLGLPLPTVADTGWPTHKLQNQSSICCRCHCQHHGKQHAPLSFTQPPQNDQTACATQPQDAWSGCLPREVWKVPRRPRKQTARRTCTTCQRNNLMSKGACTCSAVSAT